VAKVITMRKEFFFLFLSICLIVSCSSPSTTGDLITPAPSVTKVPFTETLTITHTPTPTNTATPAITPAFIEKLEVSDLSITENNAKKIIKLSVFGEPADSCIISSFLDTALKVQVVDETTQYLLANKELERQIINIWDIEEEKIIQAFDGVDIDSVFFHPDKNTLITFTNREKSVIGFWDTAGGNLRNNFVLDRKNLYLDNFLGISPDGLHASTFSGYGNYLDIRVSEISFQYGTLENKDSIFALFSEEGATSTQFYSPSGNLVAIVNGIDNKLHFLDLSNSKDTVLEFPFENFDEIVSAGAVFSKASMSWDEKFIVSGALNGDIYVWNTEDGVLLAILKAHQTEVTDGWRGGIKNLEFSPDSHLLLSVGYDGFTKLWNIPSGDLLKEIKACHHFGGFTQDGHYLITIGKNGIEKWGIP
jgi:WD40 repeat protein